MKKALFLMAALAATGASAAPFVWPAAWSADAPSAAKRGGTLRTNTISDYGSYNPFTDTTAGGVPIIAGGGGLFTQDPITREFVPYAAESYKVSNGDKRFVITLRQGMKFSDGSPITADDYVTTAKINADADVDSNNYSSYYVNGKPIVYKKLGTYSLQVDFPSVSAEAYANMTGAVWPNKIFGPVYASGKADGIKKMWGLSTPASQFVTAAAFTLDSYQVGQRLNLKKNPYFGEWNKDSAGGALPYLDAQTITVVKDTNADLASFLQGSTDLYNPANADQLSQVKAAIDGKKIDATLLAGISPNSTSSWIVWNWNRASDPAKQALFRNVQFRRAMSMIANRQAMVQLALGGVGTPVYTEVYPVFTDWIPKNLTTYPYNPQGAAKLLASIGYTKKNAAGYLVNSKGQQLEFDLTTNAGNKIREQLAQIFVDEAKKVGVKVNFQAVDFNSLVGKLTKTGTDRPFDAILLGLSGGSDVFPFGSNVDPCTGSTGNLHAFNTSGKCLTPQESLVEKLYYQGDATLDRKARIAIGNKILEQQSQQQGFVYLVGTLFNQAYLNRVGGFFPRKVMDAYVGANASAATLFIK